MLFRESVSEYRSKRLCGYIKTVHRAPSSTRGSHSAAFQKHEHHSRVCEQRSPDWKLAQCDQGYDTLEQREQMFNNAINQSLPERQPPSRVMY